MAEKRNSEMILKMLGTLNEAQSRWYVATLMRRYQTVGAVAINN